MKLLRTLAMAAALAVAAADDTPSPSPSSPSATMATPTPSAATSAPAAATTPTPAAVATYYADSMNVTLISGIKSAKLDIKDNVVRVSNGPSATSSFDQKPNVRLELVTPDSKFELHELVSSDLKKLEIDYTGTAAESATVALSSFRNLAQLTDLSFSSVRFNLTKLNISALSTLTTLKFHHTNVQNIELLLPANSNSSLTNIDFDDNSFDELPLVLYQRMYAQKLNIMGNLSFYVAELSPEEYSNAQQNLQDWTKVSFAGSCDDVSSGSYVICETAKRTGVRTLSADNSITPTSTPSPSATPTPTPTKHRDSANTTLTVVVVVIAVIAAVLAFFVARRYFWSSSSSSRSPRLNERTVGLISKDESHAAAQGKLSFISSDDTLRPIRLEPQEVTLTKSLGAGKLWIGDYQGRKVIIKRVEAESSDSYATKALITQAKGLATLKHPSVVGMVGVAWVQGTDFGIVAEFMEKGTLKAMLMDLDSELDLQSKLHMCLDVAQALLYLHSNERNMYMKQLSSRKVLVNNAVECKVNLFECHSCSAKVELPEVFGAGMLAWAAPEVVTRAGVLNPRKMNIFSLGVLMCEIMTRVSPYQSEVDEVGHTLADLELLQRIRRQEKLLPHENRREFMELPVAVRDVVERCLSYQPLLRPTAEEVVQILEAAKGYSERFGSTTSL